MTYPPTVFDRSGVLAEPVSVLVPVSNEAEGIEAFMVEMMEIVGRYLPEGSEVLVDEAGSLDGTKEVLKAFADRYPMINVEYRDKKDGFANAAKRLYRRAKNPITFFTDSDGQCVMSEFWKLAALLPHNDWVLAVKKTRRDPLERKVLSWGFNTLGRMLFRHGLHDINFGFRVCRRDKVLEVLDEAVRMRTLVNAELTLLAHRKGHRITEVHVYHRERVFGKSQGLNPNKIVGEAFAAFNGMVSLWSATRPKKR
jgi:glycosyltransferase involved in cell wall biosynthesis